MKSTLKVDFCILYTVTPFTGVWIEILYHRYNSISVIVTPFTGVWIEIVI